ncbi:HU domain-containing protein [Hymenobacter guriensis]|uniref:SPOR domain-containing protein n=1 Tax=Hymenobacter guriensis TaxID=2793065 RepID=A0ABS0L3L3_9BACT|nr:SPOR domain-containing protein [Hymenobacter guriensis]MBG8554709.1 SPOR domain-containing protein [Hymenobacter guriensis]
MQLSDHISALLRDHDCVIIPEFGGLIADYSPAHIHPVRHTLAPPAKRVAFNQALTRNDGLLVDALSRTLNIPAAQARQLVRDAVVRMQSELTTAQRTELPGIGIFRHAAGRGLDFEYTGTHNLLTASFGLPELLSRPVRATDAMQARERGTELPEPVLRASRSRLGRRVLTGVASVLIGGLVLSANYLFALRMGYLPENLRSATEWVASSTEVPAAPVIERQQAALAQPGWNEPEAAKPAPVAAVAAPAPPPAVAPEKKAAATLAPKAVSVAKKVAEPVTTGATISGITNRWYVAVVAVNNEASARKLQKAYASKGKATQLLLPRRGNRFIKGTRFYRLSAADFADQASAKRHEAAVRKQFGVQTEVINY